MMTKNKGITKKIYEISWSEGHSAGLYEVENWVEKLAELVKD